MSSEFEIVNFNDILISPINYIVGLLFFLGLSYAAIILQKNIGTLKKNKFLENFLILLCLLVLFINGILLLRINIDHLHIPLNIFIFLGLVFLIYQKKIIIDFFLYINKNNNKILKISLILIFLNSILSPIDIDSLDYHIGFPGFIEDKGFYEIQKNWFHSAFFFNGEVIGLIGLIIKIDFFLNFLNILSILIFFRTIELTNYNANTKNIIKLLIISCPAVIQLILSAKPFLFPLSIIIYSFYQLKKLLSVKNFKDINSKNVLIHFVIIFFGCSFRYEFYIFLFIIIIYFIIFNISSINKIFKYSLIGFLINISPILLRNFLYFKDPIFPFLSKKNLSYEHISFIDGLGSTGTFFGMDKVLFFPLNLFISIIPEYFITTLGFTIIPLFFILKKKFINKDIFIILTYSLVLLILGKISYPRFFIPSFLLFIIMSGLIIQKFDLKIFKFILFAHLTFSLFILSYSLIMYGPMLINENFKSKILTKTVDNYYVYKTISQNFKKDEKFIDLTKSRNNFDKRKLNIEFDNNKNDFNNLNLFKSISGKKDYIIIEKSFQNYLIKNDIKFRIIKKFNYKIRTRNPLFNKTNEILIIKF